MSESRYKILNSLPAYGPMYIPVTVDGFASYSEGVAVDIVRSDGSSWIGSFQPGHTKLTTVIELHDTSSLIVIAQGNCYIVDVDLCKALSVLDNEYESVLVGNNDRIVLQNSIRLTVVESNGSCWHSEQISWDGLTEISVNGNLVTGLAYDPTNEVKEWDGFTYDLENRKLTGGTWLNSTIRKSKWWRW